MNTPPMDTRKPWKHSCAAGDAELRADTTGKDLRMLAEADLQRRYPEREESRPSALGEPCEVDGNSCVVIAQSAGM